jgi:opacity protein-like surface antigen
MSIKKQLIFFKFFGILLFIFYTDCLAQNENIFNEPSFGIEVGNWRPNNLRHSESTLSFRFDNKYLYFGAYFLKPINSYLGFRLTSGYFSFKDDQKNSFALIPILVDIRYLLLNDSKISPYLTYGIGACIGHIFKSAQEGKTDHSLENKIGYSINLGTGFEFLLLENLAIGFEFRYHYLKFSETFISSDDYSGTKINLVLSYLFR